MAAASPAREPEAKLSAAEGYFPSANGRPASQKRPHARGHFLSSRPVARDRVLFERGAVCRTDQTLRRQDAGGRAAGNSFCTNKFSNSSGTIIVSENVIRPDRYFLSPMYHVVDTLGLQFVTLCYSARLVKVKRSSTTRQQALLVNPLGVLDLFG